MTLQSEQPLISVGIPTYNHPKELSHTLECVVGQTYKNLEIIVSDNCSPGKETQDVVKEFADKDPRVKYYRQEQNRGSAFNFKFVLEKATGQYFAWIADDDHWNVYFLEKCLSTIKNSSSAMCKIRTFYTKTGLNFELELPDLSPDYSKYRNYKESLLNPVPGLIYGLHRRCDILWFLKSDVYDFSDCFFISRICVEGKGVSLINDYTGFQSNIIGTERYLYKPFKPSKDHLFLYKPFVKNHFNLIANSPFPFLKKRYLNLLVLWRTERWFTKYEKKYKPIRVWLLKILIMRPVRTLTKLINWLKK